MRIKRYEASNMEEAISKVKSDLGPEAIILHTRRLQRTWPMSFFKGSTVEITAALDVNLMDDAESNGSSGNLKSSINDIVEERLELLQTEMEEVKTIVKTIAGQLTDPLFQEVPASFLDIYETLISSKVDDEIARKIMQEVQDQLTPAELSNPTILRERTL
ncbi:MAG: hypothetical protein HY779_04390, partial [Rubrobacteridae bacterium]|nr:hypothetical protein [Rubrobacteridae bacterium]